MKKYAVIVAVFLSMAAGCDQPTVTEAKEKAAREWSQSRSKLFYGLALDFFKTGQLEQAEAKTQNALRASWSNTEAHILLGRIHIEQGLYETAIKELTELCDRSQKSAEARYVLGVANEKEGLLREARANYDHAFVLDPTNMAPVVAGAEVLVAMGKITQAQRHLENQMTGTFREPAVYELAGRIAMRLKEYDKAVKYFQQARSLDHKNKRYPEMLASAHFAAGDFTQAGEILRGVIYDRKDDVPSWVHLMLADCLLAEGNILEAKATYRQASQTRPKRAGIWASLAKVALMGNDLTLAMQGARRARKLDANHLDAAILLGYALLRKGEQKLACEVLRSAWNNHPDNTMLLSLLGRGYAETGREDEARECYALALRLEPQNKVAGELLVRLDNKVAARTVGEHPRSR